MKRNREQGNIIVFTALGMTVLLGMAGLAVDVGALRHDRRLQQTAADAAAIAGASNLSPYSGYLKAAGDAASANGFADSGGSAEANQLPSACSTTAGAICVSVNAPPKTGPHANTTGYVEAYVTVNQPTYFMRMFGTSFATETVTARAVATNLGGGNSSGCDWTLGPPTSGIGININGSAVLNATHCGIIDNGNLDTSGSKLTVTAGTFGLAGGVDSSGHPNITCTDSSTCPVTGMPASGDPFSYLGTPPVSGTGSCTGPKSATVCTPGIYSGGVSINANSTVTFQPGSYEFTGSNLSIGGGSTVTGNGVLFYFTGGATIDARGNSSINLSPETSGNYAGILIYQDPSDTAGASLGGTSGSVFKGALYFPKADLTFFGDSGGSTYGLVVAYSEDFSGNPTVNMNGDVGLGPGVGVIKNAVLVE